MVAKIWKTRERSFISLAIWAAVLAATVVSAAGAQRAAAPRMSAPAARPAMQAPRPVQAPRIARTGPSTHQFTRNTVRPSNQFARGRRGQVNCANGLGTLPLLNSYPSYGFTFAYQNAINRDLSLKAAIDPATQLRLSAAQRFGCETFTGGGYYVLGGGYGYPAVNDGGPADDTAAAQQPDVAQEQPAQTYTEAPDESAVPVQDEGQFVLVMRDGSRVEAVAFMRSKDALTYITTEGLRRSIALVDIDSSATVQVNEERGTPLKLPL